MKCGSPVPRGRGGFLLSPPPNIMAAGIGEVGDSLLEEPWVWPESSEALGAYSEMKAGLMRPLSASHRGNWPGLMSTMAKFCSSVVSMEAGELLLVDEPEAGVPPQELTLMWVGESRLPPLPPPPPPPNIGFGDRGDEMDDLPPPLLGIPTLCWCRWLWLCCWR